jgi:4-hydroxy-tetrahydrodipicolinate synthase
VIDGVADARLRLYVYHIPPVTQVAISASLIERLIKAYPTTIAGIKDSGGQWEYTAQILKEFQPAGFDVFAGTETILLPTLQAGGAGCITATGNVNPAAIVKLYNSWHASDASDQQQALNETRAIFQKWQLIAAMKAAVAKQRDDSAWRAVRPPLVTLSASQEGELIAALNANGFHMRHAHV